MAIITAAWLSRFAHPHRPLRRSWAECRVSTGGDRVPPQDLPALYQKAKHTVVKPGDTIPMTGIDWRVVTSHGETLKTALPAAGRPNPSCATFKPQDPDETDNARSVGSVVTFGQFRLAHLGDLTWNKEFDLMCPANRIGTVDLFVASHHGLNVSNSEVLHTRLPPA